MFRLVLRRRYCRSAGSCRSSRRRSGASSPCRLVERLERRGVDRARHNRSSGSRRRPATASRSASAARDRRRRRGSRLARASSARGRATARCALVGRQVGVARRQGEAVRSRTVGTPTISTGRPRSATIRRITASCWKSFSPNKATSGRTASSSLATTVATPSKWPGRASPSQRSDTPDDADRGREAVGIDVVDRRQPQQVAAGFLEHRARPLPPAADSGRGPRSAPNCVGLTKIVAATLSARRLRLGDQRHVPGVERAHGRHQRERAAALRAAQRRASILHCYERFARAAEPPINFVAGGACDWRRGKDQAMSQPHFIVFANEKGGTGKSTTAVHTASRSPPRATASARSTSTAASGR